MRLQIGKAFGIPIFLHWTFAFVPLFLLYQPAESEYGLALSFTVVPLIFGCVVLHEFGHALMARRFGIDTQDVTLYPIGGVARLVRMTERPLEEFLIAVAGPAVNVMLALLTGFVLVPLLMADPGLIFSTFAGRVGLVVLTANIVMILFNMLPAFPMDGGRVLRAFLSSCVGHYQGTQIAVGIGMCMAVLIGIGGAMWTGSIMLVIVMGFVFVAGQQELAVVRAREQQRLWDEEEPLEVLPVMPVRRTVPLESVAPLPALMFQPKISVYTWNNQTGTWHKDPPK